MDTIDFFRVYGPHEDQKAYTKLKKAAAPAGCKAWIRTLKGTKNHICWFKIQCHEQLGYSTPTKQDIANLRSIVDGWLACADLSLDDFTLARIDYDYNFYMSPDEADLLLNTMQQLSTKTARMEKWNGTSDPTVYYQCKSRHMQLYRKDKERKDKKKPVKAEEECMCRQEVQCHSGRIKYMRRKYGLVRDWDNWVTPEMEAYYLTAAESVFPSGDFYSLDRAAAIIQASSYSDCKKKRLQEMLAIIQKDTVAALKDFACPNTIKKYFAMLKELNVNPLTIKVNPEDNPSGITYIKNPFFKSKGI
ncbi:MAG: hypothetical protein K2O18_06520 [Oscillospiraceae bacterium]|nr:hypothetical protein [Oscillospiraceae bacterium]